MFKRSNIYISPTLCLSSPVEEYIYWFFYLLLLPPSKVSINLVSIRNQCHGSPEVSIECSSYYCIELSVVGEDVNIS